MTGVLAGVRVLAFGRYIAGPYCGRRASNSIIVVRSPGDDRAAVAGHPDHRPVDAGLQLAPQSVVRVEGFQLGQQGHGPRA
jgi:crotonobetainyl-CoA:carnitine CoA-transferase CaiB-like acyl-CoA transferase